jgi:hypothetical protein
LCFYLSPHFQLHTQKHTLAALLLELSPKFQRPNTKETRKSKKAKNKNNMSSHGPAGGSSEASPFRVGGARGTFVVPKTGNFFEIPPLGRAGALVILSAVVSAGFLFAAGRTFSPPVPSRDPSFRRKAAAIGPVAERVCDKPVFLNPIRNRIPGYTPTPEDVRRI